MSEAGCLNLDRSGWSADLAFFEELLVEGDDLAGPPLAVGSPHPVELNGDGERVRVDGGDGADSSREYSVAAAVAGGPDPVADAEFAGVDGPVGRPKENG